MQMCPVWKHRPWQMSSALAVLTDTGISSTRSAPHRSAISARRCLGSRAGVPLCTIIATHDYDHIICLQFFFAVIYLVFMTSVKWIILRNDSGYIHMKYLPLYKLKLFFIVSSDGKFIKKNCKIISEHISGMGRNNKIARSKNTTLWKNLSVNYLKCTRILGV